MIIRRTAGRSYFTINFSFRTTTERMIPKIIAVADELVSRTRSAYGNTATWIIFEKMINKSPIVHLKELNFCV